MNLYLVIVLYSVFFLYFLKLHLMDAPDSLAKNGLTDLSKASVV